MREKRQHHRVHPRIRRRTPPGALPGSVVVDPDSPRSVVRVIAFGPDDFVERVVTDYSQLPRLTAQWPVCWIRVEGLGDANAISQISESFGLHCLAVEDVVNTHQRAKVDDYGDSLFVVARMASFTERLETRQLGMFLGKNYVITFEERPNHCFEPIVERIRARQGRIRQSDADYLAYGLLDSVIDGYFPVLDQCAERLEDIDSAAGGRNPRGLLTSIHNLRADLLLLRRAIWPHREAISALARDPHTLVSDTTRVFLRDCLDHIVAIVDLTETYREMCTDLREYVLSTTSARLNEIMKVLTIIATVFMPLTFIAGLYGMNFDRESPWNMPELGLRFGYPAVLAVMFGIGLGLLWTFYRLGWMAAALPMPDDDRDSRTDS
jgi:magnesium transporter